MIERNKVVLVDRYDNTIGEMDKLKAHEAGLLHRAFSVFIFNNKNELLLQQRASNKYHGADLWTNTCCSHPQLNENLELSALERLHYEMGICCDLKWLFSFVYNSEVENNLIEHEFDHVFVGYFNEDPTINLEEAKSYKWLDATEVLIDLKQNPASYTVWFRRAFPEVLTYLKSY